ncbi:MAG: PaaI family thioesterase [Pseudomonadota bacterium]
MTAFTLDRLVEIHDDVFAPWIKSLRLMPVEIGDGFCLFCLPQNGDLTRRGGPGGGVICGQAVSAAADTASVLALCAANQALRPCTTVDLTAHFMRPLPEGDVDIRVEILSNGRRMAVTRAEFRAAGSKKLAATVTCAFAYLDL